MQQRLAHLEQMLQQAQSSVEHNSPALNSTVMDMNDTSENLTDLHSLEVRPSFTWTTPNFFSESLSLDEPLFTSPRLRDDECKKTIEIYPPIENLHYQPTDTIPVSARKMNHFQSKQDMPIKKLQYLVYGVFRPLDVLGLEITTQMNELRNNIAFQTINPNFTTNANSGNFTMDPSDFHAALVQQTNSTQALQNSGARNRNRKRNFPTTPY
ncbi:hypothetical protein INT47_006832 [Mucor saturninus]|uniref:Uncharacterized protein n=1 Tax=Mucor saturninus TaxID=64648 RepID=A0A8H7RCT0_9FUNG|nr:hypothetical protein INT47_006832 [Mucor saturninus]